MMNHMLKRTASSCKAALFPYHLSSSYSLPAAQKNQQENHNWFSCRYQSFHSLLSFAADWFSPCPCASKPPLFDSPICRKTRHACQTTAYCWYLSAMYFPLCFGIKTTLCIFYIYRFFACHRNPSPDIPPCFVIDHAHFCLAASAFVVYIFHPWLE